jgi:RecA-family ATPase
MIPQIRPPSTVSKHPLAEPAGSLASAIGWKHQGPALDDNGYDLVPIKPGTKRPATKGWPEIDFNSKGFDRIFNGFGIGVKGAKTPGVDFDIDDEKVCRQMLAWCYQYFGAAPIRIGRAPRSLLVYKSDEPLKRSRSTLYRSPDGASHQIELIGKGGQFVAYAIHPDTGLPYLWPEQELTEVPSDKLSEITQDDVDALFQHFDDVAVEAGWTRVEPAPLTRLKEQKPRQAAHELTAAIHDLRAAMSVIPIQPETYDRWRKIGMALYHATEGSNEGFAQWDEWSSRGEKYDPDVMGGKWRSFGGPSPGAVLGARTIFAEADKVDPTWRGRVERPDMAELGRKLSRLAAGGSQKLAALVDKRELVPTSTAPSNERPVQGGEIDASVAAASPMLNVASLASFDGQEIAEMRWVVDGMIPANNVTDLAGDGGTGKSLLALQLAVAVSAGKSWLGRDVEQGCVLYMSCEDGIDEIRRRLEPILSTNSLQVSDMTDLMIADLTVAEGTELADVVAGKLTMTRLYGSLVAHIAEANPKLVIIDTRTDAYGGNEIDRLQVRTFVRNLRKLCIKYDLAVLLLSHPSITGMSMGSGQSGSTAWGNSVRSRLYLERCRSSGGDTVPDPDLRTLTVKKNNYGTSETETILRWRGGFFQPEGLLSQVHVDRAAQDLMVEQEFLRLLDEFTLSGQRVAASKSPTYAPALFAKRLDAECGVGMSGKVGRVSSKQFALAMERLFAKNKIRLEEIGPPSRRYSKLIRTR